MPQSSQLPLSELIRMRRKALGWSQQRLGAEVAKREGLRKALTAGTVQQWESGETAPQRKRIVIVADLLGISTHEMFPASRTATNPDHAPSLEESIRRIALALEAADPQQRDVAAALLSGLARDPGNGQFVTVLSGLLDRTQE